MSGERESHYVWGKRYLLQIVECQGPVSVELSACRMTLSAQAGISVERLQETLECWYRAQLRQVAVPLVAKWEKILGVKLDHIFIRRMKTKWGSCSRTRPTIRLNTELAKKPVECLEYIVIHEMAHLLHGNHGVGFQQLLDRVCPMWRESRMSLNRLPVGHEDWRY